MQSNLKKPGKSFFFRMFKLVEISENKLWDDQIIKSPQYSLFCSSSFLDGLETKFKKYFIYDGKELAAAFCVAVFQNKKKHLYYKDFHYNQSIYFLKKFDKNRSLLNYQLKILTFFIEFIIKNFNKIRLSLHYSIKDIRSFLFYNFGNKKNFKTELKYSFIINLLNYTDFEDYLTNIRPTRRQDLKYFYQNNCEILVNNSFEDFKALYKVKFPAEEKTAYQAVFFLVEKALKENLCRINFAIQDKKKIASTVFLYDKKSAYYLHGFSINTNEKFSNLTSLILEQVRFSFSKKIDNIDMCGANSPKRADYKSGFDGLLESFFEISYE